VKGKFPIGFFIWNTEIKEDFNELISDIYDSKGQIRGARSSIFITSYSSSS
jgi:hypothetical protein